MVSSLCAPRGAVAAGHVLTAEAGAAMLRQGGNAFDAAIAAAFTACVTESVLTSLGGGGFLLAHTAAGHNVLFDFFCQTPESNPPPSQLDFFPIQANFGDTTQEFHVGLGSMAVPGSVAGYIDIHRQLGRLPLKTILAPARHWATRGITVGSFQAYCFEILSPILTASAAAQAIYVPGGKLLGPGDRLYLGAFADFLEALAQEGSDLFYQGDLAHRIATDCERQGGYLRLADLQSYRMIAREPLAVPYRGGLLLTNPPPSSGGTLIAFALKLLADALVPNLEHGSPGHVATLVEVMRLTNLARQDGYDSHLYQPGIADQFLSPAHSHPYQQQLKTALQGVNKWGSTTHISAIDTEGNAVSLTTSNGEGSSYVIPGTAIMVNNMLGEEDLNPRGFHQWQPNQRISSMMAPTIVLHQGKPSLVLGSGGSNRIRTAILQVVSNVLDFGFDLDRAVHAPRLHWERGALHLEAGYDRPSLQAQGIGTAEDCTWWQASNMFFGGVHAVAVGADGSFTGVGDRRRNGACVIV
ncbi:MAG: gamma-glutamyltransferase [Cyanobacteria bacterium REEB459]|nr:gamma-glutamyltransferase [Cyanobacteria bacterium REEB459]